MGLHLEIGVSVKIELAEKSQGLPRRGCMTTGNPTPRYYLFACDQNPGDALGTLQDHIVIILVARPPVNRQVLWASIVFVKALSYSSGEGSKLRGWIHRNHRLQALLRLGKPSLLRLGYSI